MELKFYRCDHCGNIVVFAKNQGVPVLCCGQKMTELLPGTSDGATEKHVPVWSVEGNLVQVAVGDVAHPMLEEHYIEFIALQTTKGWQLQKLQPQQAPKATFALTEGEGVEAVYAYCNLHGLWKA